MKTKKVETLLILKGTLVKEKDKRHLKLYVKDLNPDSEVIYENVRIIVQSIVQDG